MFFSLLIITLIHIISMHFYDFFTSLIYAISLIDRHRSAVFFTYPTKLILLDKYINNFLLQPFCRIIRFPKKLN